MGWVGLKVVRQTCLEEGRFRSSEQELKLHEDFGLGMSKDVACRGTEGAQTCRPQQPGSRRQPAGVTGEAGWREWEKLGCLGDRRGCDSLELCLQVRSLRINPPLLPAALPNPADLHQSEVPEPRGK